MDQQAVEVLPFLSNCSLDRVFVDNVVWGNGDPFKDFGFSGLEHCDDPLDARIIAPECQVIEFSDLGEVDERCACIQ